MIKYPSLRLASAVFLLLLQTQAIADLPDFAILAEKYSPAVVNISTTQKIGPDTRSQLQIPGLPENHQFGELFRRFFEQQQDFLEPDIFDTQSMGSGFIVSQDGYVLTNAHVVEDADKIIVKLHDRRELIAQVIGTDEQTDIALLKIEADNLPTVKMGSSKSLKVGEWVMAIGNPFGFEHTVTAGIVSAKGRSFYNENYVPFIQTDVAINPGNSGGPLFNTDGEVIGVNSRISSEPGRRSYTGLSFAIPAEVASDVMSQLRDKGRVSRGWLGVMIQDVTPELAQSFGLTKPQGALVARVLEDSPAESGKIQVGDIIMKLDGTEVNTSSGLPPLVGSLQAGQMVTLEVMRHGNTERLPVRIGELPERPPARTMTSALPEKPVTSERLGLDLENLTEEVKAETGAKYGVMVTGIHEGPAEDMGLQGGDIIQVIDNKKVTSVEELRHVVASLQAGKSVAILVYREAGSVFLAMRIPD